MVGYHGIIPHPFGKLMGNPLDQPPGVHKDQSRLVLLHQSSDSVQRICPEFVGSDRAHLQLGQLDGQVHGPGASCVDDQAIGCPFGVDLGVSHQESSHFFDGALGGGETDAGHGAFGQRAKALHGQGQVRAAFIAGHGVNLVEDEGFDRSEAPPATFRRQQDVEGLWGSDQYVGRPLGHPCPL